MAATRFISMHKSKGKTATAAKDAGRRFWSIWQGSGRRSFAALFSLK